MLVVDQTALVQCCRQRRERLRAATALPVDKVWQTMMRWIVHQLGRCNGASIPQLCTLTWRVCGTVPATAQREAKQRYRALCVFSEHFLEHAHLKPRGLTSAATRVAELVKTEPLNCMRLALNFSSDLTKDVVFAGSRELIATIYALVAEHRELAIEFGSVGLMVVRDRYVSFEFAPEFLPASERDAAHSRLAEIRKLAAPSNDPLYNRHADVPTGDELLLDAQQKPGGGAGNAREVAGSTTETAAETPRPLTAAAGKRTPLRRESAPLVPRHAPLNPGLPRSLTGGDLLVRPGTALSRPGTAMAAQMAEGDGARGRRPGSALRARAAGAPLLLPKGGASASALADAIALLGGPQHARAASGAPPPALGAGDPTSRRGSCSRDLQSRAEGGCTAGASATATDTAAARAAPPGTARPPKPLPAAQQPFRSLASLQVDADELELDKLALSPVARLLPGQGAKHTPPSSPTFTAVERDLSPGHVPKPLARDAASAVLKQNRCLSPGGAARMMEWLTHSQTNFRN